jgi:hypothetical protein
MSREKLYGLAFEIDQQLSLDDVKELGVFIVLMPAILTLHYPEADHGMIDSRQRQFVPGILATVGNRLPIDDFRRSV